MESLKISNLHRYVLIKFFGFKTEIRKKIWAKCEPKFEPESEWNAFDENFLKLCQLARLFSLSLSLSLLNNRNCRNIQLEVSKWLEFEGKKRRKRCLEVNVASRLPPFLTDSSRCKRCGGGARSTEGENYGSVTTPSPLPLQRPVNTSSSTWFTITLMLTPKRKKKKEKRKGKNPWEFEIFKLVFQSIYNAFSQYLTFSILLRG